MNVYSNSSHFALKYLKDIEVNISNLLIMTGDFNIRDNIWDSSFPHHSTFSDNLMTIADSFNLELLFSTHNIPTRYLDLDSRSNLVIDLIFLQSGSTELNTHSIHPDWCLFSDHAPLSVSEENIESFKFSIAKNNNEEISFIKDVSHAIKSINVLDLSDSCKLEEVTNSLASRIELTWKVNLKQVKITKHSKSWWNEKCKHTLDNYKITRSLKNWKAFKSKVKSTK